MHSVHSGVAVQRWKEGEPTLGISSTHVRPGVSEIGRPCESMSRTGSEIVARLQVPATRTPWVNTQVLPDPMVTGRGCTATLGHRLVGTDARRR